MRLISWLHGKKTSLTWVSVNRNTPFMSPSAVFLRIAFRSSRHSFEVYPLPISTCKQNKIKLILQHFFFHLTLLVLNWPCRLIPLHGGIEVANKKRIKDSSSCARVLEATWDTVSNIVILQSIAKECTEMPNSYQKLFCRLCSLNERIFVVSEIVTVEIAKLLQ